MNKKLYTLLLLAICSLIIVGCSQIKQKLSFLERDSTTEQQKQNGAEKPGLIEKENKNISNDVVENEQPIIEEEEAKQDNSQQNQQEQGEIVLEEKYFNQLTEENGLSIITNPENVLSLVNKQQALPASYTPTDLVSPNVAFSFGNADIEKRYIRQEAALALEEMFTAASNNGISLYAVSGYRSFYRQEAIFNAEVKAVGEEKAKQLVAVPGQSEHQTGLAMDISSKSVNFELVEAFGETEEGKWVESNAHHFGFIIRYPKGKEAITGYQYEPWHLRYVGKEKAKIIFEKNMSLEEFFEQVKKM